LRKPKEYKIKISEKIKWVIGKYIH
jgi:hypothetical protein